MGVDVDVFDNFKQTPLFFAAKVGNLAVARLLLMLGMQPNFRDVFGQTALYYAVSYGHVSMVRLLVGMGAAADVACHLTKTPKDMTRNTKLKGELNKYILEQKQRAAQEIQRCGSNEDELREVMSRQAQRLRPDSVCPDTSARSYGELAVPPHARDAFQPDSQAPSTSTRRKHSVFRLRRSCKHGQAHQALRDWAPVLASITKSSMAV